MASTKTALQYLLIRPYPSLRVLFASPSLRIPGMLQSPIMDKIGGNSKARDELTQALAQGRSVTATVRWITKPGERGRNRWIAFTPLLGSHKQVGVWIAVLVDDELENEDRPRQPPPVKYRASAPSRAPAPAPVIAPKTPTRSSPEQPSVVPDPGGSHDTTDLQQKALPDRPVSSRKEAVFANLTQPITTLVPEIDENYETLEVRLQKKRDRDAARLRDGVPVKPTYKSLSPYAFMNNDGP
jgi:hypothetical protein